MRSRLQTTYLWQFLSGFFLCFCSTACATKLENYPTVASVDIGRFMGSWYVHGHTPVFFDKNSSDQVESYRLDAEGGIDTQYSFLQDGRWHHYHPYGRIYNQTSKAHWKMQFLWPFSSDYLIVRLAPDYSSTVISVPKKDMIWIMTRTPKISEKDYERLLSDLAGDGYDITKIRRVAHTYPYPY